MSIPVVSSDLIPAVIKGVISYYVSAFLILAYLDSFTYVYKNILVQGLFGVILVFIHSKIGFTGYLENSIYVYFLYNLNKGTIREMFVKYPNMNDLFRHKLVEKANLLFLITYIIKWILFNVRFS